MNLRAPPFPPPKLPDFLDSARHEGFRPATLRPRASRFCRAAPRSSHAARESPPRATARAATRQATLLPSACARRKAARIIRRARTSLSLPRTRVSHRGIVLPSPPFRPSDPRCAPARVRKTPRPAPRVCARESQAHARRQESHKQQREQLASSLTRNF